MSPKFLPLLLLLAISALLSANINYVSAQHQTFFTIIVDPCTGCKIRIANGTGSTGTINTTYVDGNSASLHNGPYNITAILASGYTFRNWSSTSGITIQNKLASPTNITLSGTGPSTLTLRLKAPVTTIQPIPILIIALMTSALPVLLRRTRKATSPA